MNDRVFGVHCSNGFCEFDSHSTTNINLKIITMYEAMEYQEIELREMIGNLRLLKESDKWGLQDQSEIDLTTYELLLENYLENKLIKSIKL